MATLTPLARQLRKRSTPHEQKLWRELRAKRFEQHKIRRQQPIGRYIVDFVCHARLVIVELDGGQHATQSRGDLTRDEWLKSQGFQVLRFWNNEVDSNFNGVLSVIEATLSRAPLLSPSPLPSPIKGEGVQRVASTAEQFATSSSTLNPEAATHNHSDDAGVQLAPLSPRGRGPGRGANK